MPGNVNDRRESRSHMSGVRNVARVLVCAAAIAWVLRRLDWEELSAAWDASDKVWIGLAFLVFLPAPLMQAVRLVWILRVQDISIGYWVSLKLTFAGNFFNNFVPAGAVGGDFVKGYYITQRTSHKTEAVTALLIDRVFGLMSFIMFALAGLIFVSREQTRGVTPWLYGLAAASAAAVVYVMSYRVRRVLRFERLIDRLPFAEQFHRVASATVQMQAHRPIALNALGATVLAHAFLFVSFTIAAAGLGIRGDVAGQVAFLAISLVIATVPVSPAGLGTMEASMVYFFVNGGYGTTEQVLLLALAMRAIQLFWAMPGAAAYLTGSCRPTAGVVAPAPTDRVQRASNLDA